MITIKQLSRRSVRYLGAATAAAAATGLAVSLSLSPASASPLASASAASSHSFSFRLVPSPGIKACLPHIGGVVKITPGSQNDLMQVTIFGAPRNAEFDLFVIQQPNKPFGVSWYQSDVNANNHGVGSASVRGIFDRETFSVSPGGTTTFPPTHQFHLGLWFNDPKVPFRLGCEPGAPAPVVTPFNGEQHAGIQALNTAQFPVDRGPLSHVHR